MATPVHAITDFLGGKQVFGKTPPVSEDAYFSLITGIGIPSGALNSFEEILTRAQIAELLQVSLRNLQRIKQKPNLGTAESDRLYRAARIFTTAVHTFGGDSMKAKAWMSKANRALGGAVPFDLIKTDPGVRMVDDVLGRIRMGGIS